MKRLVTILLLLLVATAPAWPQDSPQTARKVVIGVANAGVTGTTRWRLAKLTGAPSTAVIVATTDTDGAIGIVTANAGTTLTATIQTEGLVNCDFDAATTAGNYVQISATTAGKCHDAGSTFPGSGQVLGRVLSTNGASGNYQMLLVASGKGFTGSPVDATYITQTPNSTLSNEQPLNALTDGLLKHTSGVIARAVPSTDYETPANKENSTIDTSTTKYPTVNLLKTGLDLKQAGPLTGDVTTSGAAATLATVNGNVGTFGSATQTPQFTVNGKGLVTAASNVTMTPAVGSITGLGTGVGTALGVNVGSAGAPVVNGGALGSPSSVGTMPAFTLGGAVSGGGNQINNAIIGASNPLAGTFTTLNATAYQLGGTAITVRYASRVSTQFDKTTSTTLADVTGLSVTVTAGRTYSFRAVLIVSADATGGGKYSIAGTATATAFRMSVANARFDTSAWAAIGTNTTMGTALAGHAGSTAYFVTIEGFITVNAGGTLTVQFAQNASNGTSSVLVGSTFIVEDVN